VTRVARGPSKRDVDAHLLVLWLHGRSEHTQRAYGTDVADFHTFVSKPLRTVTVATSTPG